MVLLKQKKKLKKEYYGLTGNQLKQLKSEGTIIENIVETPFLCYLGDTDKNVFDEEKIIAKYPIIMIECTFIFDETNRADETKHMHWDYLNDFVKDHPDNTFILYHFSQRYKPDEIENFFEKLNIKNVIPWISR